MANDRIVEEIKQRLPLEDFIGRVVDLKRAGRTYKACCPFHAEKTPSFVVFPHTQTWHCFGACGVGGDLFSFVQKREGLSFADALQLLARQAGVVIEEESPQQQAQRSEREKHLAICDAAATLFQEWLRDRPDAASCRDYIDRRGLSADTVGRFGLGYAPDRWDDLLTALTARGYEAADLAALGLIRQRENGGSYDYFRNRLMFPIRDERGRVIGFGARTLESEQTPKYLNSPQTPLFDKSRTLYALELARDSIRTVDRAVVVEGYMDAITAHQNGYANVVASLGTALTASHIQLLSRYSPNITLALDADEAGQRAAERGLDTVVEFHREIKQARWERARQGRALANQPEGDIRVLVMPDGDDPDDLIRRDPAGWQNLVDNSLPVMDFLIQRRVKSSDLRDPVQKQRAADDLLPLLKEIDSAVVRDHYVRQVARLMHVEERLLLQELARAKAPRRNTTQRSETRAREPERAQFPPEIEDYEIPTEAYEDDFAPFEGETDATPVQDRRNAPATASPNNESDTHDTIYQPGTHEGYVLYLLLEEPQRISEAVAYGVTADVWAVTEHRELWKALVATPPSSNTHVEEFAEVLAHPVAQRLRRILTLYASYPPLPDDSREAELLNQLDAVILAHEREQERQLQFMIDDLQRDDDYDRAQVLTLQSKLYQLTISRYRRQRLRQERHDHRRQTPIS